MAARSRAEAERIRREAARRVVAEEPRSPSADGELLDWLGRSPDHVGEYLQASALWEALADPEVLGPEALAPAPPRRDRRRRRRSLPWLALAAALGALALGAAWWSQRGPSYTTAVGEITSFQLDDRSVISMNADSRLWVDYSRDERRVVLESGEAAFEVATDPERPFVVESGSTRVTAVGTRFVVRRSSAGSTVTVVEGHVVVEGDFEPPARGNAANAAAIAGGAAGRTGATTRCPLGPGERLEVQERSASRLTSLETPVTVPWQKRRLVFDDETLEAVAAEFNRFNTHALRIEDPELRGLRISGVFDADDPASLLAFLAATAEIESEVEPDGTTVVRLATEPSR